MIVTLAPNASSVGTEDKFSGNFTKAIYIRSKTAAELELLLGYAAARLTRGWWLLFALERPPPENFEFGGFTYFSGGRIRDPKLGTARPTVEQGLRIDLGSDAALTATKVSHVAALHLSGDRRLAKVVPVTPGNEYPAGKGIYQCNIPDPILCRVAALVLPGAIYTGLYT